ncbi:hypothetical protein [Nocardia xishanensis]|uniref:Uncharacterized protein n=1 Tax=Nocardia xishanensis TaxID=238964 RepID=A0ABW7X992_9NOCA
MSDGMDGRNSASPVLPEHPGPRLPRRIRRIRIVSGALTLNYRASAEQARNVADLLACNYTSRDMVIIVDDRVDTDLPPLPCAGLWD